MRKLIHLFSASALTLGLTACVVDSGEEDDTTTATDTSTTVDTTADTTAEETTDADADGTGTDDAATTDTTDAETTDAETTDAETTEADADTTGDTGVCEPYGDPGAAGTDCCEGEMGIGAMDIDGFWCAGACTLGGTGECAAASAGMAQCAIDDGMGGGLCAVLCQDLAGSSDCPTGMTCQDTGQMVGICTWAG